MAENGRCHYGKTESQKTGNIVKCSIIEKKCPFLIHFWVGYFKLI